MDNETQNVAETVRDIMEGMTGPDTLHKGKTGNLTLPHLVAMPGGRQVVDLTSYHRNAAEYLKPSQRKGTARLEDLESLIAWANRFKGATSALYAKPDMSAPSLTCIADYHGAGGPTVEDATGDPTARHCHHRATYGFPLSDEWKAWTAISGKGLDKDELGEFIETNAKDITDPTPAILSGSVIDTNQPWENRMIQTAQQIEGRFGQLHALLSLSRHFQVFETSNLEVKTNRDTGEGQIQFLNEHRDKDGAPLTLPNLIMITIPVFHDGAPYRMCVRFRYRKSGSAVKFILSIYNPERAFKDAFGEAIAKAEEDTGLPLFLGTPEA